MNYLPNKIIFEEEKTFAFTIIIIIIGTKINILEYVRFSGQKPFC